MPTAGLQTLDLAAWDNNTAATICNQMRARVNVYTRKDVQFWAQRRRKHGLT